MQDATVFDDMIAQAMATGRFRWAQWGRYDSPIPAEGATLQILRLSFLANIHDMNTDDYERTVKYRGVLTVYMKDDSSRKYRILDIEGALINLYNNKRLGNITIPYKTICEAGIDEYTKVTSGMSVTYLNGSFSYIVDSVDGMVVGS